MTRFPAAPQSYEVVPPNPWMILPFVLLLGAIALAPLLTPKWWLRHYAKVALGLGAVTLVYYILILRDMARLADTTHEYVSFVALVGSLYVVAGGIHVGIKGESTPLKNVVFLLAGAVIANVLGTTGAAMLLIRPWIRMNKYRVTAHHIVFLFSSWRTSAAASRPSAIHRCSSAICKASLSGGSPNIAGRCGQSASGFCSACFMSWTKSIFPARLSKCAKRKPPRQNGGSTA